MAQATPTDKENSQHYFSPQPQGPSQPVEFEVTLRGLTFPLVSDRGVFSHGEVDKGSRLLAETMQLPVQGQILDLGCGWGVLGLVAAKLAPEAHITLIDVNQRAASWAEENLRRNKATNAEIICGDAPVALGEREFEAIVCNPPVRAGKHQVLRLVEDAARRLGKGGALWLVVRTDKGAKSLGRDISPWFTQVETVAKQGGYRVLRCTK